MKLTLRFQTSIGPRVGVLEVSDEATAIAILNAHLSDGNAGAICDEATRLSLKDHLSKHRRKQAKDKLRLVEADPKVLPMRKAKKP